MVWCSLSPMSAQEKPNILWIVCEDISPTLSMYGDSTARTPNLDALAADGMIYDYAFAPVGVCAPTRSAIITGMYPTSIGTMHMRTGRDVMSWGQRVYDEEVDITDLAGDTIRKYAAVIPEGVKCFPEYLRAAGYYCTNNQKTDYQFAAPVTAWDENDNHAHWRNRPEGKPFFSVFNIGTTHESRLWRNRDLPLTVSPASVPVPPYLPDNETTRTDVARHYSNVELMDAEVGEIIRQLREDGLYDKTIIFFYSDHGGPLPRQKREIYDSGLRVPLIIKSLKKGHQGRTERMISFVDYAPTLLSIAGIKPPAYMEGKAFMGRYEEPERTFVFGSSDRFDEYSDRIRAVRTQDYLYIRNFLPELPKYKDVGYRKQIPLMQEMLSLHINGKLSRLQESWFGTKVTEELYHCPTDPHNLKNLATDPAYHETLTRMRNLLWHQMNVSPDWGQLPEATMIDMMWPDGMQPETDRPWFNFSDGKLEIGTSTPAASIGYMISDQEDLKPENSSGWQLYTGPVEVQKGQFIYAVAERIGFRQSQVARYPGN